MNRFFIFYCFSLLGQTGNILANAEIDFSTCGYRQSEQAIPLVPIRAVVTTADRHDDRPHIQAAIDHVSGLKPDQNGFRGAVLLQGGPFLVRGSLAIRTSGVVLRGSGVEKTSLRGIDPSREPIIRVVGESDLVIHEHSRRVVDESIPVGASQVSVDSSKGLKVGNRILITRPSTKEWIAAIGMDREGIAWKPGTRDIRWERRVVRIESNRVTIDAPITTALEQRYGGARIQTFAWPGRLSNIGIENLELISLPAGGKESEDRPWCGVTMENVENAWVRQVSFSRFPGSAVALWETTKNVTVQDCLSSEPVSEIGGYRRHTFFTMGQQSLFLRCWSENGRHDFSTGHGAAGPNAFVSCQAHAAIDFSGPIGSWASGVLYDNVTIDGAGLHLQNRWRADSGAGWCAANCTIWQSNAAEFRCFIPPGAVNRATGTWGTLAGNGIFEKADEFVKPRSLFNAQLAKRLGGADKVAHLGPIGRDYVSATNPTPAEAEAFVNESSRPAQTLRGLIGLAGERARLWDGKLPTSVKRNPEPKGESQSNPARPVAIRNGRLTIGDRVLSGKRFTPIWWRGNVRPAEAPAFGPALTRFVPGRIGRGFTDDLQEVAKEMVKEGVAVVEHHHGLWYDRRRDDHTRVRRANGNVIPPFYEQPFARSGEGKAFDGLSKYDLSKFNPWYWGRIKEFADLCDESGLVLLHQHYFQHNLLEAGAHWTDFPWRSANNINDTGFPEPPPYAGDKRIFQAHLFYDSSHPRRRDLHQRYIRQCLENTAGNRNVIHSIGAEFTGPQAFVEFWIDTIVAWERETSHDVLVSLSCTKDVQDAILADPARAKAVSIIDIRYWWYTSDGKLHAPAGGMNLSPRQHARRLKPKNPSTESKRRAVHEYRRQFPDKAVLFNGEPYD